LIDALRLSLVIFRCRSQADAMAVQAASPEHSEGKKTVPAILSRRDGF